MTEAKLLSDIRRTEKEGRRARRLSMLIVLANMGYIVTSAAATYGCNRKTVSLWRDRRCQYGNNISKILEALSDRPRSGRPTKISKKHLDKAKSWCDTRTFTPIEMQNYLEKISGVKLSLSQTRRYIKKWGCSCKKTSPLHIKRASPESVAKWYASSMAKVRYYTKQGYAIATMDESHFKDSVLSTKYWAKRGLRIFMPWSGGHHRFSMLCTITDNEKTFFNHTDKINTDSFVEHIDRVYKKVGKMVLFLDEAPWHASIGAQEFFDARDIVLIWYPVGHPYLNPVEEIWSILKRSIDYSIRYSDIKTHLTAVYGFVKKHEFDYDFKKHWKRKPPAGIMRPFVRSDTKHDDMLQALHVSSKPRNRK